MADTFDPYLKWLGIKPKDQPPHHYRLLGIDLYEDDPDIIENTADQKMVHLRTFQAGERAHLSQQLLNEISTAKICLLTPEKKAAYDAQLKQQLGTGEKPTPRAAAPKPNRKPAAAEASARQFDFEPVEPVRPAQVQKDQEGRPTWRSPAVLAGIAGAALLVLIVIIVVATREKSAPVITDLGGEPVEKRVAKVGKTTPRPDDPPNPKDPADNLVKDPARVTTTVVAGRPVDLLGLIDPARDALTGQWRFENGNLVSPVGHLESLQIPYQPPTEYRIDLMARRREGNGLLGIGLSAGGRQFLAALDSGGGYFSGLTKLDGKNSDSNETTKRGSIFSDGQPHSVAVTVRQRGVQVDCDGRRIIDWTGDWRRLSAASNWSLPNKNCLFLVCGPSLEISKISATPLGAGQGTLSPPPTRVKRPPPGNYALQFDGKRGYVEIPTLKYDDSHPITIEATVSVTDSADTNCAIVSSAGHGRPGCSLFYEGRYNRMRFGQQTSDSFRMSGTVSAVKGKMMQVVGVWDGTKASFSCDGKWAKGDHANSLKSWGKVSPFLLGAEHVGGSGVGLHFPGTIDEVRISKIARYERGDPLQRSLDPDEHTLALYHFDEGQGDLLKDSSGNGHHGKIYGAKWVKVGAVPTTDAESGPAADLVHLDDLQEKQSRLSPYVVGLGKNGATGYPTGQPQRCIFKGAEVEHALSVHPPSKGSSFVDYDLDGKYRWLETTAGLLDRGPDTESRSPLNFKVIGDGKLLWQSRALQKHSDGQDCRVNIAGVKLLRLEVDCPGIAVWSFAAWINPRLVPGEAELPLERADNKLPVPRDAARKQAEEKIKAIFKDDIAAAKTPEEKLALAAAFLTNGREVDDDSASRYVLLEMAAVMAAKVGNAEGSMTAIDTLAELYEIDRWKMKVSALAAAAKAATGRDVKEKSKRLTDVALAVAEDALAADQYGVAAQVLAVAVTAARRTRDVPLIKAVAVRKNSVEEMAEAFEKVKAAFAALEADPEDPAAALAVGSFLAFVKGDWDRGLPVLIKGNDAALTKIAQADLAAPMSADERLKLADNWWDMATDADRSWKKHINLRAGYWYGEVRFELEGLPRSRVEKRLQDLARRYPDFVPKINYQKYKLRTTFGAPAYNLSVAFSPDGKTLATNGKLWDIASGKLKTSLAGDRPCAFSPDGKQLALGNSEAAVVWDIASGNQIATLRDKGIVSLAISPDGKHIVTANNSNVLTLWDAATGKARGTFKGHAFAVRCTVFSPSGKTVASSSFDKTVKLWDAASGQVLKTFTGHAGNVGSVVFSPDGRLLASGSNDRLVKIWDIATGREKASLAGHSESSGAVCFSPDGKTLASGHRELKLWDVASGREIITIDDHPGRIYSIAFSPHGKLLVVSGDGRATVLQFDSK